MAQMVESACSAGDLGSIPGSGRSPAEGNGNPLQYSCLKIPWAEEAGRLHPMGSQRVRHGWATNNLNMRTFISKVLSLLFNVLPSFVIAFLPRRKHLLISWLQSLFIVILEPKKENVTTSTFSICHEVMGLDAMILVFFMLSFKLAFSLSCFILITSCH